MYKIEKYVEKLINGEPTGFLNSVDVMNIKGKLNKNQYKIYSPTKDSEKVIFYNKKERRKYKIKSVVIFQTKCLLIRYLNIPTIIFQIISRFK